MNYVLRYVFYAVGILVLAFMCSTSPEHAQFSDLVRLMQSEDWWRNVGMVAFFLAMADMVLSVSALVPTIMSALIPDRYIRKPQPQRKPKAPAVPEQETA
ncbi:hypothetical protein AB4Y45_35520 [Paraburkholderia sp. EG287A]|uniref:hypothetical protein n=1 Tax=Paraburkholderia sp. EG287A TaxID=3237012 RepID=UPI0034D38604